MRLLMHGIDEAEATNVFSIKYFVTHGGFKGHRLPQWFFEKSTIILISLIIVHFKRAWGILGL